MSVIIDLLNLLKIHIDGPQDQVLEGDAAVNVLSGGAGNDYVEGKGLADLLSGGTGNDTLGYVSSNAGVNVDLTPNLLGLVTLASGGHATGDIITADFENLIGSAFSDTLKGTNGNNIIAGLAGDDDIYGRDGDDILIGGAGEDDLYGGNGFDIADYSSNAAGIHLVADAAGRWTGTGGDAQGDTLVSIEKIIGTSGDDIFDGSALTTALTVDGGGGNDTIIGGAGDDTFAISDAVLKGGDPNNPTNLGTIDGRGGDNLIDFSGASEGIDVTLVDLPPEGEITIFGTAIDYGLIAGGIQIAELTGVGGVGITEHDDTFHGSSADDSVSTLGGNDLLEGKGGADKLDGGAGIDTSSYASSSAAVTVNLASSGQQTGGHAAGDTLISIENLIGSGFADTLTGSAVANNIKGGDGNDTISGGGGNDVLQGGSGRDLLTGGIGNDNFVYTAISGSPAGADATLDRILDFTRGQDHIDLSALPGTATFVTGGFTGVAGQVHVVVPSRTAGFDRMELDSNGDGAADLAVLVNHQTTAWSAADFVL